MEAAYNTPSRFPAEIYDKILSYLPVKCAYDRVENSDLWIRISLVSKEFQQWVYSDKGPFKLTEAHRIVIPTKSLRCFINLYNREKSQVAEAAFLYINKPDNQPEIVLASVSPFLEDFGHRSLIGTVISKMSDWYKGAPILKMFFNQMALEELVFHFSMFIDLQEDPKECIKLLDLLYEALCAKTGNETFAKSILQSHLGELFHLIDGMETPFFRMGRKCCSSFCC